MIPYPEKRTEFEVQSDMYQNLKSLGLNVRGEITESKNISKLSNNKKGFKKCRFDIVVFNSENVAVLIIEVKRGVESNSNFTESRQYRKYKMYNLPLLYCWSDTKHISLYDKIVKCVFS